MEIMILSLKNKNIKFYQLTDADCYEILYKELIQYVPHYMTMKLNITPGGINYIPSHMLRYHCIVDPPLLEDL